MDSELQIGLIALGVAAVLGIIGYNKWQERKHRRQAENAFRSDHPDVLLDAPPRKRVEPSFEPSEEDEGIIGEPRIRNEQMEESEIGPENEAEMREPVTRPATKSFGRHSMPGAPAVLDPRVDCVICVEAIEPLDAPRLWAAQSEQLRSLSKPVSWFAFNDSDNLWHELNAHSAGAHHWFCVAMQMVDRRGAVDEEELRSFAEGVQRVADQFLAVPADIPLRSAALANAGDMDRLCASVDVQVGINLVGRDAALPGGRIRTLAESCGLQLADDGSFHAVDAEGRTQFMLSNNGPELFDAGVMEALQTRGVTFIIDVPLVSNGAAVFESMMRAATAMAESLGGVLVDDNHAPFGLEAAEVIRSQIQHIQAQMEEGGIPPGSALALRLFSA